MQGPKRVWIFVEFVDAYDAYYMNPKMLLGREITVVLDADTRKRPEEMRKRTNPRGYSDHEGRHSSRNVCSAESVPQPKSQPSPNPSPSGRGKWCVVKADADVTFLQNNINYACGSVGCKPIQSRGACFDPNNVQSHASYVMNAYFQANGHQDSACDFKGTGVVTSTNPSYGNCKFVS